jgi:hypothetical protein
MTASIQTASKCPASYRQLPDGLEFSSDLDLFKVSQEIEQARGKSPIGFVRIHRAKLLTDLVLQTTVQISLLHSLYGLHP